MAQGKNAKLTLYYSFPSHLYIYQIPDLFAQKKGSPASFLKQGFQLKRRRPPTLPHCIAVPSAQAGLTSLFGMGRGGPPLQ